MLWGLDLRFKTHLIGCQPPSINWFQRLCAPHTPASVTCGFQNQVRWMRWMPCSKSTPREKQPHTGTLWHLTCHAFYLLTEEATRQSSISDCLEKFEIACSGHFVTWVRVIFHVVYSPQVLLVYGQRAFCGGVIYTPTWILTAAHCLENLQLKHLKIIAGTMPMSFDGPLFCISL